MNMRSFLENGWTITIIGGVAVIFITFVVRAILNQLFPQKEEAGITDTVQNNGNNNSQTQTVTVNVPHSVPIEPDTKSISSSRTPQEAASQVASFKREIKILFIDDQDLSAKMSNLKGYGWKKIKQVKDAPDVVSEEIREADVIFVDYKGIAMQEKLKGLAVISRIRAQYGNSKWLILFTAHPVPLDAFDVKPDSVAPKNATPYQLEQKIIEGSERLRIQ